LGGRLFSPKKKKKKKNFFFFFFFPKGGAFRGFKGPRPFLFPPNSLGGFFFIFFVVCLFLGGGGVFNPGPLENFFLGENFCFFKTLGNFLKKF